MNIKNKFDSLTKTVKTSVELLQSMNSLVYQGIGNDNFAATSVSLGATALTTGVICVSLGFYGTVPGSLVILGTGAIAFGAARGLVSAFRTAREINNLDIAGLEKYFKEHIPPITQTFVNN